MDLLQLHILAQDALSESEALDNIIALAAIIVPLALVPYTFKLGGAAMSAFATGGRKLQSRIWGGADGKGGLRGKMAPAVERRKHGLTTGSAVGSRSRVMGAMGRQAGRGMLTGALPKSRFRAAAAASNEIDERAKQFDQAGLSFDELQLMSLGSKDAVNNEVQRLATIGDSSGSSKLRENFENNWSNVSSLAKDPINSAAAATRLADSGFATESGALSAANRLNDPAASRNVMSKIQGKMQSNGIRSAAAWGQTGNKRMETLTGVARNLSSEAIQTGRDFGEFAQTGGALDDILRHYNPEFNPNDPNLNLNKEATKRELRAHELATKLQSALAPGTDTSAGRAEQIREVLTRRGISTEPPAMRVRGN